MLYDNEGLAENLFEVWDKLKSFGTVKSIVNEYTQILDMDTSETEYDVPDEEYIKAEIQQSSSERARAVFNDDDYYNNLLKEIDDAIDPEDIDILDTIMSKFKEDAPGVMKDVKWEKIKEMWEDYQDRDEDEAREKAGV
jgi:hypothetical protein